MKRLILAFAILIGWASVAWAATPNTLTTPVVTDLRTLHAMTNDEASRGFPIAVEATVTYCVPHGDFFIQEGDIAVYVEMDQTQAYAAGDRVLVRGKTHRGFRPEIMGESITFLHHGQPPLPAPAEFAQLIHTDFDSRRVIVHGVVRSADLVRDRGKIYLILQLLMDGGTIHATVGSNETHVAPELVDAEVEITGVAAGRFDSKMQMTGVLLEVPGLDGVRIVKNAPMNQEALPFTPLDEVLFVSNVEDRTPRVRVKGVITYYLPGTAVVLQSGSKALYIQTQYEGPLMVGDLAMASGIPNANNGDLALTAGLIEDLHERQSVMPLPVTGEDISAGNHAFELISVEGNVLMAVREETQDEYVVVANGHVLSAVYRHPFPGAGFVLPPMKQVPLNAKVRITGISMVFSDSVPTNNAVVSYYMLLRNFDDVAVIAEPSWLNVRNLILLVGLLLAVVIAVGARGWFIERKVRRQTATLAYIERRRSRILEDINGSRPLAEIIEEITELVSFKLKGAPCWCQIVDGALLGNCPQKLSALRIVQHEIPARSGAARGTLFAAFDPLTKPSAIESEALSMAAALATLAIETRRLYSDLLRRSEFDLLTDIHNRFSLDKRLEDQIDDARQNAGIFGLVYIDLDGFKQINDLYGHQVGDLYLQEVALRMKRQLRNVDMLARVGGDEFAALVPVVRSRADVEEIALRLERCFDGPFDVEGNILHGSASVGIALYPQDANTKDSLLNAADAAMYVAKHIQRQSATAPAGHQNPGLTPEDYT
jgi:diguanylate cyclase (GGDEF)-like protein